MALTGRPFLRTYALICDNAPATRAKFGQAIRASTDTPGGRGQSRTRPESKQGGSHGQDQSIVRPRRVLVGLIALGALALAACTGPLKPTPPDAATECVPICDPFAAPPSEARAELVQRCFNNSNPVPAGPRTVFGTAHRAVGAGKGD